MRPSTTLVKLNRFPTKPLIVLFWLVCIVKTYFSIYLANIDLIEGRFALFIDEQVFYDGIFKILHPENLKSFFFYVVDAYDHRYGRVFWYTYSAVCFLPEIIIGQKGLILFSRISSVFFLSVSYLILCKVFFRSLFFRLFAFLVFINIPFSSYYMTMPKPEPLQMFFLSLFFVFFKKHKHSLNKKYWFFLGLSVGAKISVLPAAIIIVLFSIYRRFSTKGFNKTLQEAPTMISYLLMGLSVAVPILLKNYLLSVLLYSFLSTLVSRFLTTSKPHNIFLITILFFGNLFHSVFVKRFLGINSGPVRWLNETLLGISHGFDSSEINFFKWVEYFLTEFISPFFFVSVALFVFSMFVIFLELKTKKSTSTPDKAGLVASENLLLVVSGVVLLATVFIKSNRIMGFYLFPGTVLFILGLVSSCEALLKTNLGSNKKVTTITVLRTGLPIFFVACLSTVLLFFWYPQNIKNLQKLANRTKTSEYQKNLISYLQINDFLTFYSKEKNRKIHIKNIGSPFVPDDNGFFSITGIMRPFTQWEKEYEALLVKDIGNVSIKSINPKLFNYSLRVEEKVGYDKYVIDLDDSCLAEKCYKRIKTFKNGTEFLVLEKTPTSSHKP